MLDSRTFTLRMDLGAIKAIAQDDWLGSKEAKITKRIWIRRGTRKGCPARMSRHEISNSIVLVHNVGDHSFATFCAGNIFHFGNQPGLSWDWWNFCAKEPVCRDLQQGDDDHQPIDLESSICSRGYNPLAGVSSVWQHGSRSVLPDKRYGNYKPCGYYKSATTGPHHRHSELAAECWKIDSRKRHDPVYQRLSVGGSNPY